MLFAEATAIEKSLGAFGGQKAIAGVGLMAVNCNGFNPAALKCLALPMDAIRWSRTCSLWTTRRHEFRPRRFNDLRDPRNAPFWTTHFLPSHISASV
jgi:hypothetical protein